jgi:MFS family permease
MANEALPQQTATGWRVVILSSLSMVIIFGIRQSFSVFFAEFTTQEGWSSASAASIFSLSMISFALGSIPAGVLLDRYGPRRVFGFGAILLGIGLFLSSRANDILHIQLAYGLVAGIALGIVGLGPVGAHIAAWFPQQRGLAIGITFAGTGFGALIFVPLCNALIEHFGWRTAYLVLAMICLLGLAPLMGLGLQRPPHPRRQSVAFVPGSSRWEKIGFLARLPSFWWLMVLAFLTVAPIRVLSVHQIAYLEEVGIERQTAAFYVGMAGFLTAITFILWGYFSDRLGRGRAFLGGAICLLGSIGILLWLRDWQSTVLLGAYSLLLGLGEGSRSGQTSAIAGDIFEGDRLGAIGGVLGAMYGFGAAVTPWLVGYIRDHTGSYVDGLYLVQIVTILSVLVFWILSRYQPETNG